MAAFSSFQYHPFLVDSPFFPNNAHMNTPSSSTSSQFHHLPQSQPLVHHHHDTFFNETTSCCVDQSSKFTMSDNELSSVTKNQSPDTSLVVDKHNKLEPGEQVTQKATLNNPVENNNKKRRNRKASFLSPPQSKEDASSGERNKKQRKRMSSNDNNKSEEKELGDNKQKEAEKKKKKNQKKCGEEPPTGYIHVRARRGQATDSHSLAERVRREKISERMKMLQRLVPGCDKVTGKALMLDEIINYVQSLQNQVEFLSMKLASVNPIFYDFTMDMDTPTPMVRSEKSNCIASPVPLALVPQCSPNQVTAFPTANNDSYLLDNSALVSFLQGQRSNVLFSEDAGSQFWDVEDQRQKLFHPYGITNNTLCSFH